MICGRCKQNKPRSVFWSVELGRHHLDCAQCRLEKAGTRYERETAPVRQREARMIEGAFGSGHFYGAASNFRLIEDTGIAQALAWTFEHNPDLGRGASQR